MEGKSADLFKLTFVIMFWHKFFSLSLYFCVFFIFEEEERAEECLRLFFSLDASIFLRQSRQRGKLNFVRIVFHCSYHWIYEDMCMCGACDNHIVMVKFEVFFF